VGIICLFIFPSDVATTKLLNEQERELAINRILADMPAAKTTKEATKWARAPPVPLALLGAD
jgi:hypothetical protein